MENIKFYSGANQENIQKAINELKKDGNEVTDIKFKEISDEFVLVYKMKPRTKPPEEDLRNIEYENIPNPYTNPYPNPDNPTNFFESVKLWAKENWFIVGIIGVGIFYYFFIYRK